LPLQSLTLIELSPIFLEARKSNSLNPIVHFMPIDYTIAY